MRKPLEETTYKSTTKDVEKIIKQLTKQDLSGLIIDVRNNGGGSLSEATSLTGLFINKGQLFKSKIGEDDLI